MPASTYAEVGKRIRVVWRHAWPRLAVTAEGAEVVEVEVGAATSFAVLATNEPDCSAAGYQVKALSLSPAVLPTEETDDVKLQEGPPVAE
jgi:hypothetical protein